MFMDPRHSLNIFTHFTYQAREGNFFYAYSWSSGYPVFFSMVILFKPKNPRDRGTIHFWSNPLMRKEVYNYGSHQVKARSILKYIANTYETTRIIPLWSSSQQSSTSKQNKFREEKGKRCLNTDHFCSFFILSWSFGRR